MRIRRASTGETHDLNGAKLLGAGGEAKVYQLAENPDWVVKIWHKPTPERVAKAGAMIRNPPTDPTASMRHSSIAWPIDLVSTLGSSPRVLGFVMPYVGGMSPAFMFFNPKTRREKCPLFNSFYLHRTARNLACAVRAVHDKGYVVGDLNESNVLVAETALVTLVDTDSFQVWDGESGEMYRCKVGKPEYTAAEMQGKPFAKIDRTTDQDAFALGVLVFQLLMEGTHPFAGRYRGRGEPPTYDLRISAGHFPYSNDPKNPFEPNPIAPPFTGLHPSLQQLFMRCFVDGHINPSYRPDARSWQWVLEEAELSLIPCWINDQHLHGGHLGECPWCERTRLLAGRDPFPSKEAVQKGDHLKPAAIPKRRSPPPTPPFRHSAPPKTSPTSAPPLPPRLPSNPGRHIRVGSGNTVKPRTKHVDPRVQKAFAPLGPRNDWAWIGLLFGILAVFAMRLPGLTFLLAMLGLPCAVYGEYESRGLFLDGKGQWVARVAIFLNIAAFLGYAIALAD